MTTDSDSNRVKKFVALRYPFNFFEECSRQLIIYKTFRGNSKRYKALMVMDELVDFVTMDPETGKRVYDLEEKLRDPSRMIMMPKELVEDFITYFHGPRQDGFPPVFKLSPGMGMQPINDIVVIREPISVVDAWSDRPEAYSTLVAGYNYQVEGYSSRGERFREPVPMIPWKKKEELAAYYTNTIPYSVWCELFDAGWLKLAPLCTRIEKIIARTLEQKGYNAGEADPAQYNTKEVDDSVDDTGDLML